MIVCVAMPSMTMGMPSTAIMIMAATISFVTIRGGGVTESALFLTVVVHIPATAFEDNRHKANLPFCNLPAFWTVRNGLSIEALPEFKSMLTFSTLVVVRGHRISPSRLDIQIDLYYQPTVLPHQCQGKTVAARYKLTP